MRKLFYPLFIFVELLLLTGIIILTVKIVELYTGKVKNVQYVITTDNNLIFNTNYGKLKYFYEPKPNTLETWRLDLLGYNTGYSINSDSLNEKNDYSIIKRNNTYRIITIGDSFTYGVFIEQSGNYSKVLEGLLNKLQCVDLNNFEVINLGIPGYDIEYTVERLVKRGIKYNPDLVIWLTQDGNFTRINEYSLPIEKKLRDSGMPSYERSESGEITTVAQKNAVEEVKRIYGIEYIIDYQKKALWRLNQVFLKKLLVFNFDRLSPIHTKILEEFVKTNNNYFYYPDLFDYWNNKYYQLVDGHPNKVGHKKIAYEILDLLIREKFIPNCY